MILPLQKTKKNPLLSTKKKKKRRAVKGGELLQKKEVPAIQGEKSGKEGNQLSQREKKNRATLHERGSRRSLKTISQVTNTGKGEKKKS